MTFTKLFSSITESTIWCEDSDTRIVWITMLAIANKDGIIYGSAPGLANRARVSLQCVLLALDKFRSPDPFSSSKEHEGRRIEDLDGGWRLLNYTKYRQIRSEDDRKTYMREYMRQKRGSKLVNSDVSNVNSSKPELAQAEAEAEAQPFSLLSESSGNGNSNHKHRDFKALIFKCYNYLNQENPPWDASDAKQLKSLIKAKPDLDNKKFHDWLVNYAQSKNINGPDRPCKFIPRLPSYARGPLNEFGRPDAE